MVSTAQLSIALLCVFCAATSAQPSSRVVGGEKAKVGQFPHQIALYNSGSFTCGGSIIGERWILTAAHCVVMGSGIEAYPARFFTARVGSIERESGGEVINFEKVIVRSSYGNFLDDVALLRTVKPLKFNDNVNKIDLLDREVPAGEPVVVSGFGRLSQGGALPNILQWNTLSAIDGPTCNREIGMGQKQILCLAHPANNGVCNGDSGGPATWNGKLAGVAGFVYGGCGNIYPDGYAKVSYHVDWIKANIN